jgi:biotin carboxyl carrier protein
MTQYKITVKDTTYDVEILDDPRNDEVLVKVNGEELTVVTEEVNKAVSAVKAATPAPARAAAPAPKPAAAAPVAAGPGTIKSPLPGVVNSIKVRAGDKVKANDEICVIEAMKAMNIIRAPQDGTVARIHVNEGNQVAYGAPLMDIE